MSEELSTISAKVNKIARQYGVQTESCKIEAKSGTTLEKTGIKKIFKFSGGKSTKFRKYLTPRTATLAVIQILVLAIIFIIRPKFLKKEVVNPTDGTTKLVLNVKKSLIAFIVISLLLCFGAFFLLKKFDK